jgi:hypothetical protein
MSLAWQKTRSEAIAGHGYICIHHHLRPHQEIAGMRKIEEQTLRSVRDEMASLPWPDAEIAGLVQSSHGVISGLQQLLHELDKLGRVDLGAVPPAEGISPEATTDAGS